MNFEKLLYLCVCVVCVCVCVCVCVFVFVVCVFELLAACYLGRPPSDLI